ncbi:squalene/phytoene synthase family protein [Roseivivax sp. CAU 1761]
MSFDADTIACARIVERGDPDRFRAVMAAPVPARRVLFPLYACNLEVARAPYVTQEPLIAEMRLQWWADALAEIAGGGVVRRHEVVTPLAHVLDAEGARILAAGVEARRQEAQGVRFEDAATLDAFLAATGGALHWAASRALGSRQEARARAVGTAVARASWLRAVPELLRRGARPLPGAGPEAVSALVRDWRHELSGGALATRPDAPQRQADLAAWRVQGVLAAAARAPQAVLDGTLPGPGLAERAGLAAAAAGLRRLP